MRKIFGFGSKTPPPPPPPSKPPAPPASAPAAAAPPPAKTPPPAPAQSQQPAPPPPPQPAAAPAPAAAPPQPSIVGRWKEPQGADVTEFTGDGTVIERPANSDPIRGRYSLEGGKLKVKLESMEDELTFPVVITATTLDMTDPSGQVTRYQKI
jgi:hypothetical protein